MRTTIRNNSTPRSVPPVDADRFLSEMSELLGLPAESGDVLKGPSPFWGPGGLMCRLQVDGDEVTSVKPCARAESTTVEGTNNGTFWSR